MSQGLRIDQPVVIIDGGYYVFYRYYATKRWYDIRNPGADHADEGTVAEVREAFWKHLGADLGRLRATYAVPADQPLVFCFDCPRGEIWRHAHFPAYKAGRKTADGFPGGIFQEVQDHLAGRDGVLVLKGAGCEADDIAAAVVRRIRGASASTPIVCITNDNDYLQLCEGTGGGGGAGGTGGGGGAGGTGGGGGGGEGAKGAGSVRVMNLQGTDLAERCGGDPGLAARAKVLMGDKSDEIPPVCAGVGPKTAAKLAAMGEEELRTELRRRGGEAALERYALNQRIIDLGNTPADLLAPVLEKMTLVGI